uniref:glucan endo-1,3-beta-D-glucosidase n=1 Tax=Euglena gracilis TaxID=3039 RepID=A0A0E4B9H2_EUGGR|nr:endo-1,3-beta-glucanase [Euglena gracilis]
MPAVAAPPPTPAGRRWPLLLALCLCVPAALAPPAVPAVPPLSTRDPVAEGFDGFAREGPHAPLAERLCFADKRRALPTHKWWLPLVRPRPRAGRPLLVQLPYIIHVQDTGLEVYYPHVKATAHTVQNVIPDAPSWHITCKRTQPYCVRDADEFMVRIVWGDVLDVTLVRGSPYINVFSQGVALKVNSPTPISHLLVGSLPYFCGVQSDPARVFKVELRGEEEWTVFTDSDIRLQCDPIANGLSTSEHFFGLIRLALSNNCTSHGKLEARDDNPHCGPWSGHLGGYAKALLEGSQTCTRGGTQVSTALLPDGARAIVHWSLYSCWAPLRSQAEAPVGKLMMTALPHHLPLFDGNTTAVVGGGHRNLRGWVSGVLTTGSHWVLSIRHPDVAWLEPPDRFSRNTTLKAFKGASPTDKAADMHYDLPRPAAEGFVECYPAGRLLARLATLVQVGELLGEAKAAQGLLSRLTQHFSLWLDHRAKNRLVYDQSWGGLIACGISSGWYQSAADCPTLEEPGTEFGSSLFNDHHFHYGYFIYVAAVIAKFNRKWASAYREKVLTLIRDIANPSPQDPHFPPYRHFDWYTGHSWASSGLATDPYGLRQEASSEALHAWFSIYLYGLAVEDETVQALGKAMLLMEAHSTNFYWRVHNATVVYPKLYEHRLVGALQEMRVESHASSGQRDFLLYGAQLSPIAPHVLLTSPLPWAVDAYHDFRRSCAADEECEDTGTVAALAAHQALLDRDAAWEFATDLPGDVFSDTCAVGAATSRTALLHFIGAYGAGEKVVDLGEEAVPLKPRGGHRWLVVVFGVALAFGGLIGYEAFAKARLHLEERRSLLAPASPPQELMPRIQLDGTADADPGVPAYGTEDGPPELGG